MKMPAAQGFGLGSFYSACRATTSFQTSWVKRFAGLVVPESSRYRASPNPCGRTEDPRSSLPPAPMARGPPRRASADGGIFFPRFSSPTIPAFFSTSRCWETVGPLSFFVSGSSFNSLTQHSPSAIRSTIATRAGCPDALKTIARCFVVTGGYLAK